MKSIKSLFALVFAASLASASFAASETTAPLIKVPKTEAAMQATRATTARDAANNPVKPAANKAGKNATHKAAKPASHQPKSKQVKAAPAKAHKAKAPVAKK